MDEEDIAVPSGSLNNRFGVVYEASQPGTDGGKTVTAIHNAKRYLACPNREKPCPVLRVILYNWVATKYPRG